MKLTDRIFQAFTIVAVCMALVVPCLAQRKITPVKTRPATGGVVEQPETVDPKANLAERRDAEGHVVFVDTVTGQEWVDTTLVKKDKSMIYPLLESVTVGVNVWDPVMRILGSDYGIGDVWAELSLHNRYKPVVEFGLGACDITPDGQNYTFHSPMAPYFKIGINYNFLYNNNPRYQLYAGIRYGFTPFKYQVKNVTMSPGYWDDPVEFSIPSQSASAGYFEFLAGLRVDIFKAISLGWSVKYHAVLHESAAPYGKPMYIPGFGKRGTAFTGSFSISYTIPLNKKPDPAVNTETGERIE